jgi:hypothetical protein
MKQKHIGKLVSLKLKGRKSPIAGLVVAFNEDWVLLQRNVVDYVIDGFVLVRANTIKDLKRGNEQRFVERVILSKGVAVRSEDEIPTGSLEEMLTFLTSNFGVFSIENKSGTACNLCRLEETNREYFAFETMNPKGVWDDRMTLSHDKIRIIEFGTDYINSLKAFSLKH